MAVVSVGIEKTSDLWEAPSGNQLIGWNNNSKIGERPSFQ